jgi:hypothetical protein
MKETDPEQSIIDEKNYEIKLLNLKINNAEIEIRLLDAGEAERKGLDEKLKEGQKELENMQKENPNGDEHPDEHTKK